MRTTLNLDDALYSEVCKATGVTEKTKLVHMGLKSLLREEAGKRLARLYGSIQKLKMPRRRTVKWF